MPNAVLTDLLAVAWFFGCWSGYVWFADRRARERLTLMSAMHGYRRLWMRRMLQRENRVVDTTIAGNLVRSVTFLASTTILILAGLLAVLGTIDTAMRVVGELRFAIASSREAWELKVFALILVFIYAFFKFTWSLRHFNYLSTMLGAAPPPGPESARTRLFAERAAVVSTLASNTFNLGLRAYYFGLAMLTWFLHPLLFAVATVLVVAVLYRREFKSRILGDLGDPAEVDDREP